jgi:C-terminal processing protease CtpA/Prc
MKKILIFIFLLQSLLFFSQSENETTVKEILEKIKDHYVEEGLYKKLDTSFQREFQLDSFKNLKGKAFAEELTKKLITLSDDQHFFVRYEEYFKPEIQNNKKEELRQNNLSNSLENFGFENVKRLEGNVGYINFKGFADPKASARTLASAMDFVANTNSLIIDLRENRGGDNEMLLLFCSYFFDKKTDLYTTYFRDKKKTVQNSTHSKVSGQRYLDKNIYILTSKHSFSAAEGVAYLLQAYKLAKVIGENTGGAANPVEGFYIQNKYLLFVPVGKVKTEITGKNWEHTGVAPDIKTEADKAFKIAYATALKVVLKNKVKTDLTEIELKKQIDQLEQE